MATEVGQADVHALLNRYRVRYEVHPYYVVWEQRPEGAPPLVQRVQAGFDVDLSGTVDKMELPNLHSEEYGTVVRYFEAVAREVQSKVGQHCTVEVVSYPDSLVLETREHLQPEAMLTIRISHCRSQDQPEGPAEAQALNAVLDRLHGLDVRAS
jgi:hypothetical protein